jgi:hypothetical protein
MSTTQHRISESEITQNNIDTVYNAEDFIVINFKKITRLHYSIYV